VAKGAHQELGIGGRDGQERAVGQEKAVGYQTMQVGMEAQEIIAVGLNRYDHSGNGLSLGVRFLEELFECLVKAPAQEAEKLAVVLEEEAEHLGDRDDVLADGDFFEDFLLDALGKENDSLLVTRGAEISAFA